LETSFYPAVEKKDQAAIDTAFQQLSAAYAQHRLAIDETVTLANKINDRITAGAASFAWNVSLVVILVSCLVLMLVGIAWGMTTYIQSPSEKYAPRFCRSPKAGTISPSP
jgi:hypothetical protein